MKNNKGFTLIEILAAVVILGVLGTVAVTGTIKYLASSRDKAFKIMSQSAYQAVENCASQGNCSLPNDQVGANETFTTKDLISKGYLDNLKNPRKNKKDCSGSVKAIVTKLNDSGNTVYAYDVTLQCDGMYNNQEKTFRWPKGTELTNAKIEAVTTGSSNKIQYTNSSSTTSFSLVTTLTNILTIDKSVSINARIGNCAEFTDKYSKNNIVINSDNLTTNYKDIIDYTIKIGSENTCTGKLYLILPEGHHTSMNGIINQTMEIDTGYTIQKKNTYY